MAISTKLFFASDAIVTAFTGQGTLTQEQVEGILAGLTADLAVPIESAPVGFMPMFSEVKLFAGNSPHAWLHSLRSALMSESETLANGKAVETATDTLVWLLEALQAATA